MEQESKGNREYKDSVFTMYMSEPSRLIDVYNAIYGTNYPLDTPVSINTLDGALFKNRLNDISFLLDGKFIVLIEHQSTINENMPLRALLYLGRIYEKVLERENIYRKKRIPLPAPEFVVLYNGTDPYPDEKYLRLSDSFITPPDGENTADITVQVLNIQYKKGKELLEKSKALYDYSYFIGRVREYLEDKFELKEAIRRAALDCEKMNVMQPFLAEHISEVENMLFTEWNLEDALKIEREEGREEGIKKGREEGIKKGREEGREQERRKMIQAFSKFLNHDQIAEALNIPVDEINLSLDH